ncbi:hypothetical protein [Nocardioides cynanchi]|uniref:hypothetical protein n=1 Tax=Nocardioides cynanchi TaxID=2558918 RepID=UPI0012483037|nr:hypothetical protein [Nocardioides cynanchi]
MAYEPPPGQFTSSVLVIVAPLLLFAALARVSGGSGGLGTPELVLRSLIWVIGLTWIWEVPLVRHMVHPRD